MKPLPVTAILLASTLGGCNPVTGPERTTVSSRERPADGSSAGTGAPTGAAAVLSFALFDECADGRGIQVRLFDPANHRVWPGTSESFTAGAGGTVDVSIGCEEGARICYGAQPDPPDGRVWGVGIDGSRTCTDCCVVCQTVTAQRTLGCSN